MKIHGKEIVDFPLGDGEIKEYFCDFYVIDGKHDFIIEVSDYPEEKKYDLELENKIIHRKYLFCRDENGNNFTIYDCYIMPVQIPVEQMKIIWHQYLFGHHIANYQNEKIISAKYILQTNNKKYPIHMFIGKNDFELVDGITKIHIDWNQENSKFNGVAITISVKVALSINVIEKILLRLLEIFSLQLNFFPKVEKRIMITEDQRKFYFVEDFVAYGKTIKSKVRLDYILYAKKENDFSKIYDNWWKLREKEVVTFNLFSYLNTDNSPVSELPIATCIQCLEGYFRIHHAEETYRFTQTTKNQIIKEILIAIDSSDNLKKICEENDIEYTYIREKFENMSGHINQYSLKDILQYAIERYDYTKLLFQYEKETKINEKATALDIFIKKAAGHRNWLSHLMKQPKRFDKKEMRFAEEKLRMLFRLTLLSDIGVRITDESLDKVIQRINQEYKSDEIA